MRPVGVVPIPPERQLREEGVAAERNKDETPRALILERPHQAFDDGDAAELADGPEAVLDPSAPAPTRECLGGELGSLVGDEMTRRNSDVVDGAIEKTADRIGRGLLGEYRDPRDPPREVIDHDTDPPAEGPDLRECEGEPRHPEAERGWNRREIGVPDVVGRRAVTTRPETA